MSAIVNLRNKYKDSFEKVHGVKLGFMSAFVKAATAALKEIPAVNAGNPLSVYFLTLFWSVMEPPAVIDGNDIVYRDYVDISVAVSSPRG